MGPSIFIWLSSFIADFVFLAIGNKPNTHFVPAEYLSPKSRLIKVNEHLQVVGEDAKPVAGVYGVGDATDFQEAKLYAALDGQAATACKNLWIDVSDSEADKVVHKPIKGTISVPLGPCGGATELFGFTFGLGVSPPILFSHTHTLLWASSSSRSGLMAAVVHLPHQRPLFIRMDVQLDVS